MKMVSSAHLLDKYLLESPKKCRNLASNSLLKVALASVAVSMLSGCVMVPDRTATVSSISTGSGYPHMFTDRGKAAAPEKVIKRTLPIKVASYSFLGRAPYICTPSGFGRTSGCFLRRG
jgi:hypothetical protein